MSALVTADLHLTARARDHYRFDAMIRIAELIERHRADTLLLLGDLTEEKDWHSAELVNDIVDVVYSFSELVDRVVINRGNHDYTRADCPFFHFLRRVPKVHWINKPRTVWIPDLKDCLFLPHTHNHERDWDLDEFAKVQWIFAHNTFAGASTEHGHRLNGIPTSIFPRDARVVSGDIHTPQVLGPVTYVGAPYTVDFGDDYVPRVLLLSEKGAKSLPLGGPQKRLVELRAGFNRDDVSADEGDIVKVRYHLMLSERERWAEIKADIRAKLVVAGCKVHVIQPVLEQAANPRVSGVSKAKTKSDEQLVKDLAKQQPEATLRAGMSLLTEA